jgi:glutamate N-acetyltransferase/amino-acid N-acetyltransferase
LTSFCTELAHLIVKDGEGASKFVTIRVSGGRTYEESKQVANSIARSPLVKTALFGQDANWGRILAAVGYSGVKVTPAKVDLFIRPTAQPSTVAPAQAAAAPTTPLHLVRAGQPFETDEQKATAFFRLPNIEMHITLGDGEAEATVWTCDLSIAYVEINADYRS